MDYYSELGEGYLKLHREEQAEKFEVLVRLLEPKPSDKLLDVGCGPGWAEGFFKCDYFGIDPALELVKLNPKCKVGKGESLPFANKLFDLIICVSALHNMEDPIKALKEMKRVCKGRLGITILKKSPQADKLIALVKYTFKVEQEVDQRHDRILICSKL